MNESEQAPQFPQYQPPQGIQVIHPKQSAPLFKMMKFMLKGPKTKAFKSRGPRVSGRKKAKFY